MWKRKRERAGEANFSILPAKKEGIEDGKTGLPSVIEARIKQFPAGVAQTMAENIDPLTVDEEYHRCVREQITQEQVRRELENEQLGAGPVPSPLAIAGYCVFFAAAVGTEIIVGKGSAPVLADTTGAITWMFGIGLMAIPAMLMKAALSHAEGIQLCRLDKAMPWVYGIASLLISSLVPWFRFTHTATVDSMRFGGGVMQEMYAKNGMPIFLLLLAISIGFPLYTAYIWDRLDRYLRIKYRELIIAYLRIRAKKIDRRLAVIGPIRKSETDHVQATQEMCRAEYEHALAMTPKKTPLELSPLKLALATTALSGFSMIIAVLVFRVGSKIGLDGPPSIALVAGVMLAVTAGGLFFGLPYLKHETSLPRWAALVLPTLLVLALVVLPLTGCASSAPTKSHVAVLFDVSRSVKSSDEDLVMASKALASRLSRCSDMTVIPVNATGGSMYDFKLPCEAAPYDDDLKAAWNDLKTRLPGFVAAWRKAGELSDYRSAFRLAGERLEPAAKRIVVVLGDMTEDLGKDAPEKPVIPPEVSPLPALGVRGAKVYFGFLESPALVRMKDKERTRFDENLRRAAVAAGVKEQDVTVRAFGLQGLEAWAEATLGPENLVFKESVRTKGGR